MPSMTNDPWAKLMIFITPKITVRPSAVSAYTPPSSVPETTAWAIRLGSRRVSTPLGPLGNGESRGGVAVGLRPDDPVLVLEPLVHDGHGPDVLARLVEFDRVLGQDRLVEVSPGQRLAHLVAV